MSYLSEDQKKQVNILDECSYCFFEYLYEEEGMSFDDAMAELVKKTKKHGKPIPKTGVYPVGHMNAGRVNNYSVWKEVEEEPKKEPEKEPEKKSEKGA